MLTIGPRKMGKTTVLRQLAEGDREYVTLDHLEERRLAKMSPALFLQIRTLPILIDEVQYAPELFSHIKIAVDSGAALGVFLHQLPPDLHRAGCKGADGANGHFAFLRFHLFCRLPVRTDVERPRHCQGYWGVRRHGKAADGCAGKIGRGILSAALLQQPLELYFFDTGLVAYLTRYSLSRILANGVISSAVLENYVVAEVLKGYYDNAKDCLL